MTVVGVFFTVHAIERYIERHRPGWSFFHARAHLIELGQRAAATRERTASGHELWTVEEPGVRLLVTRDRRYKCPTVVTILPPHGEAYDPEIDGVDPDVMRNTMAAQRHWRQR